MYEATSTYEFKLDPPNMIGKELTLHYKSTNKGPSPNTKSSTALTTLYLTKELFLPCESANTLLCQTNFLTMLM